MEVELLGWPDDRPTVQLDHRAFSYAGKFVMSNTGKAIVRDRGAIVAAVSFSPDRTDTDAMWLRYLTVRHDRRGEGIGARLVSCVRDRILVRGYDAIHIAVNNPFAYQALYRAGFAFSGRETGIAELVLTHPHERSVARYREGLTSFLDRPDLGKAEREFIASRRDGMPPAPGDTPTNSA